VEYGKKYEGKRQGVIILLSELTSQLELGYYTMPEILAASEALGEYGESQVLLRDPVSNSGHVLAHHTTSNQLRAFDPVLAKQLGLSTFEAYLFTSGLFSGLQNNHHKITQQRQERNKYALQLSGVVDTYDLFVVEAITRVPVLELNFELVAAEQAQWHDYLASRKGPWTQANFASEADILRLVKVGKKALEFTTDASLHVALFQAMVSALLNHCNQMDRVTGKQKFPHELYQELDLRKVFAGVLPEAALESVVYTEG